jgi:hypothetical protein
VEVVVVVGFVVKWQLPLDSQFVSFCGRGTKFHWATKMTGEE